MYVLLNTESLKKLLIGIIAIFFVMISVSEESYALGKITNSIFWNGFRGEPDLQPKEAIARSNGACATQGKNRCWVSDPDNAFCNSGNLAECTDGGGEWETGLHDMFAPKIAVNYEYRINLGFTGRATTRTILLSPNECQHTLAGNFVAFPLRICARVSYPMTAKYPGDPGYDPEGGDPSDEGSSNDGSERYGNKTGIVYEEGTGINYGPPRALLCAYRDSWDLADTNMFFSPYHKRLSASEAEKINAFFKDGLFPGMPKGFNVLASISFVGIGFLSGIIKNNIYNYDVRYAIGCIPVPIGPMPPAYCHDCWQFPIPMPVVWLDKSSNFYNIKTRFQYCKIDGTLVECRFDPPLDNSYDPIDENGSLKPLMVGYEEGKLIKIGLNSQNEYFNCNKSSINGKEVEFCSEITNLEPSKVCMYYQLTGGRKTLLKCIPRPDFMPLPEIFTPKDPNNQDNSSSYLSPKVGVRMDNKSIILQENPEIYLDPLPDNYQPWTSDCGEIDKVEFCVYRPCKQTESGDIIYNETQEYCINEPRLCVEGYEGKESVVINRNTDRVIYGLPNKYVKDHWEYFGSEEELAEMDENNIFSLRRLTLEELGLCLGVPHNPAVETFRYTSANDRKIYTVPGNCGKVRFSVLGGGAAGKWTKRCTGINCDYSGGGGGYSVGEIEVSSGDRFEIIVGKGGNSDRNTSAKNEAGGEYGGISLVRKINTSVNLLYATGGYAAYGGSAGGVSANIFVHSGYDGEMTTGTSHGHAGGNAGDGGSSASYKVCEDLYDTDVKKTQVGYPGSGGCASDDYSRRDGGYESWGVGANGLVTVQCVAASMDEFIYNSCSAQNKILRSTTTFPSTEHTYYRCSFPAVLHGERPSESSCSEDNSLTSYDRQWGSHPSMPVCNDGVWVY